MNSKPHPSNRLAVAAYSKLRQKRSMDYRLSFPRAILHSSPNVQEVTAEEYAQIEGVPLAISEGPNNWCRNTAITEAREGSG
jgi:hypothetical protein